MSQLIVHLGRFMTSLENESNNLGIKNFLGLCNPMLL